MKFKACILRLLLGLGLLIHTPMVMSDAQPEFRVKAAFIYNFIAFTEWPNTTGSTLNLCIYGQSPLDKEIDALHGRFANNQEIITQKHIEIDDLHDCQIVFIATTAIDDLPQVIDHLQGKPTLIIADSKGAAHQGAAINMSIKNDKIIFDANLGAARQRGLKISSKLLGLAHKVYP